MTVATPSVGSPSSAHRARRQVGLTGAYIGVMKRQPIKPEPAHHPRETQALIALTFGLVTGPIGLIAGWWLTSTSNLWSRPQKIVAALAVPLPLSAGAGIIIYTLRNFTMEDDAGYVPPWEVALVWTGFLSLFIVPVGLAIYLSRAADKASR